MRAADDTEHTANLEQMRYPQTGKSRIPLGYIKKLKKLSSEDVATDPSWTSAPIVVTSNSERLHINHFQAGRWAALKSVPRITWKLPIETDFVKDLPGPVRERIYEAFPQFTGCFVKGAPGHLCNNINPGIFFL